MTLDELMLLKEGDVVIVTKIDEKINNHTVSNIFQIGEELIFIDKESCYIQGDLFNFYRKPNLVVHYASGIHNYIDRKSIVRERKLNELGI